MGVEPHPTSIKTFSKYHRNLLVGLAITSQFLLNLVIGTIIIVSGLMPINALHTWLIIAVLFFLGTTVSLIILHAASDALYDIIAAISYKIGEPTTTTPPHPNAKHYARTGLKAVLQAIYDYDPSADTGQSTPAAAPDTDLITQALNHTSCGIIIMNPQKRIISANKAAPIGRTPQGDTYLALDFLDDESLIDWLTSVDADKLKAERTWRRIATDTNSFAKTRYFDIVASYEKGAPGETVIVLFDRTDQYAPEEEDLNFISFAAHELRGPITIIRGYLDVLEQELVGRLKGDEPQLLARLTVSANRLSGYINNILNVAKFDRHHLKVHLAEDHVGHIYASIADDMQLRASTQHRLLTITIPDDLPTVAADRSSIGEVISNLIDNAIKYSFEGGTVTLTAAQKGDFIEVSVADNGVGMPANVVKNLFHKFYRSHRSREAVAGTGIGLYLCKAFIESHGGTITARSKENEGSVFSFTVPIYATVKDQLLEDGQLNRQLIRKGGGWIKNHAMYRG